MTITSTESSPCVLHACENNKNGISKTTNCNVQNVTYYILRIGIFSKIKIEGAIYRLTGELFCPCVMFCHCSTSVALKDFFPFTSCLKGNKRLKA